METMTKPVIVIDPTAQRMYFDDTFGAFAAFRDQRIKEMAAALGRTVQAVRTKRRLIDVDPRMSALCGFTALERDRDADE